jgi:eukaryotic-like serine/threonine-protein kinase
MPSEFIQRQIDRLLNEAETALGRLDWDGVYAQANAILALDPTSADARALLDAAARAGGAVPSTAPSQGPVVHAEPAAPSVPPLPTSFAGGRYAVRAFLGEGAKKRVYLAHDSKLDRDVAFALIKTDGLDADGIVRVRREAQAMGRLGDHANIVTIFDTGDEGGAPFIVSQYRGGGSVEDLLAKAEQHRIAPNRAMRIGEQVCHALVHAHGRAVIHRDLKPGNVWLDADGNAALGDFGLAIAIDRSRMTMQGMMVGTVAYMAPEQALGRPPDARSDLYALGAMLYEMVCGRPPFLGDDAVGVISQHINTKPLDPSWHNPEVPKPLEVLILRLLAKSPDERPASAHDVATELRRVLDRSTVEPPPTQQPDAVTDLRGLNWGFFVGRREEMDGLKDALENALSGKGSLAMLVGEPGIGKTRLAEEFGVYAGLRGSQVLIGHCYEGESSLPYRPFVEALRQYTRSRPDAELRNQLGPGAPEIATLVSEIRARFPDIEEAPKLDPEAERLRLFESVTEFLHNASTAQPLVLHLDDLHWADKPSLLLLQHLAQRSARDRLLILGAYRDIELDRTHPLSEALGALRRLPNYRRVLLRGLPLESVADLLGVVEPSEEAAAGRQLLAAALHQETEGNPFFIREVLAHLIETGKLVHEGGRWVGRVTSVSELGIPEGVREVIGRRLSRLSDGCNKMLTLASTMTGGFTWEALKAINADVPEAQLLDLLEEALAAQLIAERKGELAGTYDFTHALIRQTLYDELSTPRRVLLHRQIGEALEKLYASNIEPHLAVLAHHFYQAAPGGDVEKAIDYATRAGVRAVELYAWEEAAGHYERALQAMDLTGTGDRQRFDLLMRLGLAHGYMGEFTAAKDIYERAALVAKAAGLAEQQALAAARYAGWFGPVSDPAQAVAMLEEALAGLPEADSPARALVMAQLAEVQYFTTPREQVAEIARAAVGVARRISDPKTLSLVLGSAHIALAGPESVEERIAIVDELLALASARGDRFAANEAHFYRRSDLAELGDIDGSQRDIEANLAFAGEVRLAGPMWSASSTLAMRPLLEGRFDEAERLMQEALALGQQLQGDGPVQAFGAQLIDLRQLQGRLAEVESLLRAQVTQFPNIVTYKCALALVHAEIDSAEEARREFDELAPQGFAALPRDALWLAGIYALTEVCDYLGDAARATMLYDLLLPYAERNITVGTPLFCTGSASRQLGMMAAVMEHWEDADRHFEDALAFDQKLNARPWVAHDQYNYAKMLLARAAPDDRAKALPLLQQALETAEELGMKKILERALALKLETQGLSSTGIYTSIDAVARAVERERPEISVQPAPDGTVTIMFSDIEESTPIAERLGDNAWQELLRKHNAIVREQLRAHAGFEVKTMGDGFMVAFQSAKKGLDCAIAIQRAFDGHNATHREHVRVRIGLHAGEAIKDGDDFYGKNVILASRVAGKALGGEILVSSLVHQLVESSVSAGLFSEPREMELKGLSGTHVVYAVAST